jgi:TldD protein
MYKEYAETALKVLKKKEVDYGEVRLEEHETNGVMLKNGIPEMSGFDTMAGMGIRFFVNNSMGFVSINNFEKKKIEENIERALKMVKEGARIGDCVKLSSEKVCKNKYEVGQKIKLQNVGPDEQLKLLKETDSEIKRIMGRYLSLNTDVVKKYYMNTDGSKIESEIPRSYFVGLLTVKIGERSGQRYWQRCNTGGYEYVKGWKLPEVLNEEVKAIEKNLKKGEKPPKGKLDVVVGPEVVGIMVHESVGHPLEADRILGREAAQAGESFVNETMLGKRIGNKIVNVVDDPTVENSAGYYLYDDEGVKARRRYLFKDGKINEFLHNRETANEMGVKSNGSARAENFDKEPIVRMSNTFLLPGDHKDEELIKGIKNGIYIRDFTEWNIDDKRYQQKYVASSAFLIKNGELDKPLYKPVLEITTPKLWGSIDAIGKKVVYDMATCGKAEPMQGVPVSLGGPSLRIKGIKLG